MFWSFARRKRQLRCGVDPHALPTRALCSLLLFTNLFVKSSPWHYSSAPISTELNIFLLQQIETARKEREEHERHQIEQEEMHRQRGSTPGQQAQEQHANVPSDIPPHQPPSVAPQAPLNPQQHSSSTRQPTAKLNTTEDEWGDDEDVAGLLA